MRFALLLTLSMVAAAAQTTLTLTGPATLIPGQTATLTLSLAGSSGTNTTALEFGFAPPTGVTISSVAPAAASTAAGKNPLCNTTTPANTKCILVGQSLATPPVLSNTPYSDGAVATVSVAVASTVTAGATSIPLNNLVAANTAAGNVPLTGGTAYAPSFGYSPCDINQDGVVNYLDFDAVVNPAITPSLVCPAAAVSAGGCTLQVAIAILIAAGGGACTLP
jgi:hypothetical protein